MRSEGRGRVVGLVLTTLAAACCLGSPAWGEEPPAADDLWVPVPFRVRDLTLPTVLVMGFMPRPTDPLGLDTVAFEFNYSASNNFQVSEKVKTYLEERGGRPRPLDQGDVATIFNELEGERFFIDGEIGVYDLGLHYGIGRRTNLSLRFTYLTYGGGYLDGTIYDFHDALGLGQSGRDAVATGSFQVLFLGDDGEGDAWLAPPVSGGFTDPTLMLSSTLDWAPAGWTLGWAMGLKPSVVRDELFLGTGSLDYGLQLTAQKRWAETALVANLAYVVPGEFDPLPAFEPSHLPSLNLAWVHRLGPTVTGVVQLFFSENIWNEVSDSELSELEFQLTAGLQVATPAGLVGIGVTENLFNFDNTPDIGLHLSWGWRSGTDA